MDARLLELYEILDTLSVRVEFCDVASDRDGEYLHDEKLIRIQHDLLFRRYISALAHECCHAIWGDVPSKFGPVNAKQERRADEWAALKLIDREEYRRQETRHDGHLEAMAVSLGVTVEVVEVFRSLLLRTEDAVYVSPRMGVGRYDAKVAVA